MSAGRALRWLVLGLGVMASVACTDDEVRETAQAYYGDLEPAEFSLQVEQMQRVMPFYVTGTALALLLSLIAVLNGLEHARASGGSEALRYGAFLLLLCFVALFLAMEARRSWLPPGHPVLAFLVTCALGAAGSALAAARRPERALLTFSYLAAGLTIPLLGVLLAGEVYLIDTTASLFIGFATGMLVTVVMSETMRNSLVEFLRRRERP